MTWIDRLERRARRLAVPNLMFFISGGMLLVYLLSLLFPHLTGLLSLDRAALFRGQVWRLLTFLFVPPTTSPPVDPLPALFQLFARPRAGAAVGRVPLQPLLPVRHGGRHPGRAAHRLRTNNYLNLSLFFAFAAFYPDYKLLIFFILPVKIKYLAILDGVLYLLGFVFGNMGLAGGHPALARERRDLLRRQRPGPPENADGLLENEAQLPQIYEIDCRAAASPAPAAPLRTAGAFLRFSKNFLEKVSFFPCRKAPCGKPFQVGRGLFPLFHRFSTSSCSTGAEFDTDN